LGHFYDIIIFLFFFDKRRFVFQRRVYVILVIIDPCELEMTQRKISNQQPSLKGQASSLSNPSSSVNDYSPIAAINSEINSEECRELLKKVDNMREILRMEKISLPQIVVVGDQSVNSIDSCLI